MQDFSDYIESCFKDCPNDSDTFKFKKRVQSDMQANAETVKKRGLKDEQVVYDLITSKNPKEKLRRDFTQYVEELKAKAFQKKLPLLSLCYLGVSVLLFLLIGFTAGMWHPGWLIVEGGATFLIIALLMYVVTRMNRRKWYPVMRFIVAGCVMIAAQFAFLFCRIPLHIMNSYLIFLIAPAFMFICDTVLATVTRQRMLIINYLITIPVVTVFVYVILGILRVVPWSPGWLMIIAALILDIIIIVGKILNNRKYTYKPEEEED